MKMKSEREVSQSCPTLRDPMDCSLPGSSLHGIFQARVKQIPSKKLLHSTGSSAQHSVMTWSGGVEGWEGGPRGKRYMHTKSGFKGFPGGSDSKESACNVRDPGSIPGSRRSPGEGNGTHCSILAWRTPWTEEPSESDTTE